MEVAAEAPPTPTTPLQHRQQLCPPPPYVERVCPPLARQSELESVQAAMAGGASSILAGGLLAALLVLTGWWQSPRGCHLIYLPPRPRCCYRQQRRQRRQRWQRPLRIIPVGEYPVRERGRRREYGYATRGHNKYMCLGASVWALSVIAGGEKGCIMLYVGATAALTDVTFKEASWGTSVKF